jgi:hypothetical protein
LQPRSIDETATDKRLFVACECKDFRDKIIYGAAGAMVGFGTGEAHR